MVLWFIGLCAAVLAVLGAPYFRAAWYVVRDVQAYPEEAPESRELSLPIPLADPRSSKYRLEPLVPGVALAMPTVALFRPSGEIYVLERAGRLWSITRGEGGPQKRLLLDFSAKVGEIRGEEGAVGLALHPEFGGTSERGRYVYVYYTSRHGEQSSDRLERYSFDATLTTVAADSVQTLIAQQDEHYDHNGGGMAFGPDGFLYLGIGDEGNCRCDNDQLVDKDLFGGVLRLDVDCRAGVSHPIARQPKSGKTQGYCIPNDNPFVGAGVLEEFWSIGLRNPYRISFDRKSHRLLAGDVGHARVESIHEPRRGSNHRWSYYEGELVNRFRGTTERTKIWGEQTPPLYTYTHEDLNLAVIGGFVYRGSKLPELAGKYVFGDNASGRVWSLDLQSKERVLLATLPERGDQGLAGFAEDLDGELYAITLGAKDTGKISALLATDPNQVAAGAIPAHLSQLGFFPRMKPLTPIEDAFRYDVNQPLSTGIAGMTYRRWVARMRPKAFIEFSGEQPWKIPAGMAFVRHIDLNGRPLETQVLVTSGPSAGYAFSYAWNADGSDAALVGEGQDLQLPEGRYRFASAAECATCHSPGAGFILGVSTRQLNRGDQLARLREGGLFLPRGTITRRMWGLRQPRAALEELLVIHGRLQRDPLVHPGRASDYPALAPVASKASAEARVRSYLDVQCAHCHHPGGIGGGAFDARYDTPLARTGLVGGKAHRPIDGLDQLIVPGKPERSLVFKRASSAVPGTQMPPIGTLRPDSAAVSALREWIKSL